MHPKHRPNFRHSALCALALTASAIVLTGCATSRARSSALPDLRTVRHVDLPRFMGDWRVIANIPYFAEKDCVDSIESYALRPDGRIENWFTFRKKSFDAPQRTIRAQAWVVNHATNAEWRVRFFRLITVPYLVIDLDPNYEWTVIGHPSRRYGWIMARDTTLPAATYEAILDRLAAQGYEPGRFVRVPQPSFRR